MVGYRTLEGRIAGYVDRDPDSGCLEWTATKDARGYGMVWDHRIGKMRGAHRVAYELSEGPIPDGLQIDHLCRNRSCCNPAHMEMVTQRENVLRGYGLAGNLARATACARGHPWDETNTRITTKGTRKCYACQRETDRKRNARLKMASKGRA